VLKAIQALKKPATAAEIIAYVKEHRLLRSSKMDTSKAVRWITLLAQAAGEPWW